MDIFQAHFKDGTNGTRDYRPHSVLYLLLRIVLSCELVISNVTYYDGKIGRWEWIAPGVLHVFIGSFIFITKPYTSCQL